MSIEAMTWALSADVGDPTRKLALVGWANHAHKDGRNAWASHATIAEYVGCSTKTIGRQVKILLAEGWLREGDQTVVAHLRADRRPIVYDLAMNEHQRREWAAQHAAAEAQFDEDDPSEEPGPRVDSTSPRGEETGGQPVYPLSDHGGTDGWTSGGTPVSDKPLEPRNLPPNPPHGGGQADQPDNLDQPAAGCRRHATRADNCRGCGTTNRQLAEQATRAAAERRRAADQAAAAADRARRAVAVPLPADLKAEARATIQANRRRTA